MPRSVILLLSESNAVSCDGTQSLESELNDEITNEAAASEFEIRTVHLPVRENTVKSAWDSYIFYKIRRLFEHTSRAKKKFSRSSKSSRHRSDEWGSCAICLDEKPLDPVGCIHCRQLVGCRSCANRWYTTDRTKKHKLGNPTNTERCPLCRHEWKTRPAVKEMRKLKKTGLRRKSE
ncbi:unnamed protein product [Cylicocyclus nassatus]|uniref:RING-type domain-containing protein n=1 Tax=Cylicocyclus nassatus TaxID=53992 RepID=A0AA36GQ60_CYLNA|nr:unnamed protein product [Cylicocyclus nassatus]